MARKLPPPVLMDKYAFTNAMNQIAAENDAQHQRELAAQRRQRLYARIRAAVKALVLLGIIAAGFAYHADIQQFVSENVLNKPQVGAIDGKTGEALKEIQAQAEKRDQVLNTITQ